MKYHWRDIGNDQVRDDKTGEIATVTKDRQLVGDSVHTIAFTPVEWAKLKTLAEHKKSTPEDCVRDFVRNCQPGGNGWIHPEAFGA